MTSPIKMAYLMDVSFKNIYFCLILFFIPIHVSADQSFPDIMAMVNGVPITREQFKERLAQSRSMNPSKFDAMSNEERERAILRTLNAMIIRELEFQEAIRHKIGVGEEEVEKEFQGLRKRYKTEEEFNEALKRFQITPERWKDEVRRTIAIGKLEEKMARQIPISEKEIAEYLKTAKTQIPIEETEQKKKIRWIIQQIRWGDVRKIWLRGLTENAVIWRWSSSGEDLSPPPAIDMTD